MFSKMLTRQSTESFCHKIWRLRQALDQADGVVVGAGAGLSASAGLTYSGERFEKNFGDFKEKYGIQDIYSGGFHPFESPEEYWAWWSRHIMINRYEKAPGPAYDRLLRLLGEKDYFVLTTNVDHQFQLAGFDRQRLFYTQGDYGLWQCSAPCHQETYDNEAVVRQMWTQQRDMRVPSELIPRCPKCGRPMAMNLRCDGTFVQDGGWYAAQARCKSFLAKHSQSRLLFLELGVGMNTPVIIKYPFWGYTRKNPAAVYACVNLGQAACPKQIRQQSICIDGDIGRVVEAVAQSAPEGENHRGISPCTQREKGV